MGKYSNYRVILKDLPMGKSANNYDLTDEFFKLIDDEESDVKRGKIAVKLNITRSEKSFELLFDLQGAVYIPCDRCLDDVSMDVVANQKLVVKFGKEYSEESDEIVIVPEEDGDINVAWFLYEFIILSLPAKRVHPAGECNKVTTQKLKKHRAVDLNDVDGDDDLDFGDDDDVDVQATKDVDPRWDALKNLEMD